MFFLKKKNSAGETGKTMQIENALKNNELHILKYLENFAI